VNEIDRAPKTGTHNNGLLAQLFRTDVPVGLSVQLHDAGALIRGSRRSVHCREFIEDTLGAADLPERERIKKALIELACALHITAFAHHGHRSLGGELQTILFGIQIFFYFYPATKLVDVYSLHVLGGDDFDDGDTGSADDIASTSHDWVFAELGRRNDPPVVNVHHALLGFGIFLEDVSRFVEAIYRKIFFDHALYDVTGYRRGDHDLSDYSIAILNTEIACHDLRLLQNLQIEIFKLRDADHQLDEEKLRFARQNYQRSFRFDCIKSGGATDGAELLDIVMSYDAKNGCTIHVAPAARPDQAHNAGTRVNKRSRNSFQSIGSPRRRNGIGRGIFIALRVAITRRLQ
jgi:hypothetical protein